MSIAEFYAFSGLDPSDSYALDDYLHGYLPRSRSTELPNPAANQGWMTLCRDAKYTAKQHVDEERVASEGDPSKKFLTEATENDSLKAKTLSEEMHPGALAPRWVIEAKPIKVEKDDLLSYQRRLLCALHGRFVCTERFGPQSSETLSHSNGIPQEGVRYCWRYWDNDGNVYEDAQEKFRGMIHVDIIPESRSSEQSDDFELNMYETVPGEFDERRRIWMREPSYEGDLFGSMGVMMGVPGGIDSSECHTILSSFWENMWMWTFLGSTGISIWDKGLERLVKSAGVVSNNENWLLQEAALDKLAVEKGWVKLECFQPAVASYRRTDGARLTFHLPTATAGVLFDHPDQAVSQRFQYNVIDVATLFDTPRLPSATSGQTKKRKAETSEPLRCCSSCGESKKSDEFSKNQRRKGCAARCKTCVGHGRT